MWAASFQADPAIAAVTRVAGQSNSLERSARVVAGCQIEAELSDLERSLVVAADADQVALVGDQVLELVAEVQNFVAVVGTLDHAAVGQVEVVEICRDYLFEEEILFFLQLAQSAQLFLHSCVLPPTPTNGMARIFPKLLCCNWESNSRQFSGTYLRYLNSACFTDRAITATAGKS